MKTILADGLYAAFDLGAHSAKAALIDRRGGKDRLAAVEQEPLKPVSEFPGEAEYREHLVQQLKVLAERLPMGEIRECVAVLNSRELQVKLVEPPAQVQPDKIEGVLQWEAKKLLSPTYRNEPFLHAWRMIRENPPVAALAVIPQSVLQRHSDLYEAAGIRLAGAYAEVFGAMGLKAGSVSLGLPSLSLINLGHAGTHLQIFAAGELKFYRFIPTGLAEFSNPPLPGEMDGFSQKIRFSFDYFRAVSKLGHIDELLFLGGGATRPEYFAFARDYFAPGKIDTLDVSKSIDISPILPEMAAPSGPGPRHVKLLPFLPALGAFWAHADPQGPSANLQGRLNEKAWQARMSRLSVAMPLWIGLVGSVILLVALLFWRLSLADQVEQARQKASIAANNLTTLQVKVARLNKARVPEVRLASRDQAALQEFLRDHRTADEVLFLIERQRPEGISVSRIQIQTKAQAEEEIQEEEPAPEPAGGQDAASPGSEGGEPSPVPIPTIGGSPEQDSEMVEEIGGDVLVIHGRATGYQALSTFAERLVQARVMRRVRVVRLLPKTAGEARFLLKGDLP